MNLTINEIAKLAQVSKGTVSKALNNYPGVHADTKKRILAIVEQMGFEPNSAAQALALKKTGSIGLVIPHSPANSLNGAFWSSLVSETALVASRAGYTLMLLMPHQEGELDQLVTTIIRKKPVDGLIIGSELMDKSHLASLVYHQVPFVLIGNNPVIQHFCIDVDNFHAAKALTEHLLNQGYQRIAFLAGPREFSYNIERVHGYTTAMADAGQTWTYSIYEPYNQKNHHIHCVQSLFSRTDPPDAIISGAGGEFMLDCLEAIKKMDKHLPELGFATFDDYQFLDFLSVPITAVRQPMDKIGERGFEMLQTLMNQKVPDEMICTLKTDLVVRTSTTRPKP